MRTEKYPYKILIIEDNPGDYYLVEDYLEEYFANIKLVHHARFKEALPSIESEGYDILLLDLSLPDISKQELIRTAGHLNESMPVIILTGYSDIELAITSLSLGVSDYLLKDTINALILYKSVLYAMERHRFMLSLRKSEKQYMDLFEMSPAPMWVYDSETFQFLDVNHAAINHYGYSKEEILSMTIKDIRAPEDKMEFDDNFELSDIPDRAHHGIIIHHRKKNGEIIFVEIRRNKIDFRGQKGIITLATDITEKLSYLHAIEEQNKNLREIAWIQSHVVRAPLARLMGIINFLKDDSIEVDEKNEMMGMIISSAEEIDSIIHDIVEKSNTVINSPMLQYNGGNSSESQ